MSNDTETMKKAIDLAGYIPTEWVTMTQATEHLWGASGRGSPGAVKLIEACATLGLVEIQHRGRRTRMVRRVQEAKQRKGEEECSY